jgi:ParG
VHIVHIIPMVEGQTVQEKRVRVNVELKEDTHRALKIWCVNNGVTLPMAVEAMVENYLGIFRP